MPSPCGKVERILRRTRNADFGYNAFESACRSSMCKSGAVARKHRARVHTLYNLLACTLAVVSKDSLMTQYCGNELAIKCRIQAACIGRVKGNGTTLGLYAATEKLKCRKRE
eukprot:3162559-Pleurochrysis_carterae.AAC.2